MNDYQITDFSDPLFQTAFQLYFEELGIQLDDWDELFNFMNEDGGNVAIIKVDEKKQVVGFIQFKIDELKNWFFEEKVGFIWEFWVSQAFRGQDYGSQLLKSAENYFLDHNIYKAILTTDTAPGFYEKQGYVRDASYRADNEDEVFTKILH